MSAPIEILSWDSRFFGHRIARVTKTPRSSASMQAVVKACLKQRVECLYFLVSAEDAAATRAAEAQDFQLMDVRVTLNKTLEGPTRLSGLPVSTAVTYRPARLADSRPLERMAATLFPNSRFALDSGFPSGSQAKLFSTWIAKSIRGRFDDWVGVAESRQRLAGFISCRKTGPSSGLIGLIGVVASLFRRHGVGRGLMELGTNWFRAHGVRHISVVTQGRAVAAQRLYQECGFRTGQVDLWYHKWF